ncbi:hypothetical protein BDQ12DRAFT_634278 [Crucibulum laeve]|uniref:RRM domain-containing protein n=1 Tax=Crucibulum laeve TaxID=68775 RepID=A0A5C3LVV0_9AGAR|nr:hypothetical protein BDQ12DRAFT_634278 [Crucibulum laeve]
MSSSLGKRKEREDDSTLAHGSTLFVSNLPYTATSIDLQTLFSDIAPIRTAFVVTEQGTGVSKGVGYVSFAIKEDAQSAFEQISKEGITLVGRKLRVQWADNKPKEKEKGEKTEMVKKEAKPRPPPRPHMPHDPLAIRTIVVSGLPPSIDSKVLWKKIRKYEGVENVDWPIKVDDGTDDPSTAHVLFNNPGAASDAVHKLHAHVFKGCLLSVTLKKRLDALSKPAVDSKKPEADKGKAAVPSHSSRLIVRNLPFNATEQDLRAVFLPYGPIYSVHIPSGEKSEATKEEQMDTPKKRPRTKGFAFVWMLSKKDAEHAIEGCNGMTVRAGTAETLVLDKQKKKKLRRIEEKMKKAASAKGKSTEGEEEEADEEEEEKEEEDDKRATERVIAVDWALSKEKWKEEKKKIEDEQEVDEDGDVKMEDGEDSNSESSDVSNDDSDDEGLGVHSGSGSESGSDDDLDHSDDEEPIKPQLPPPETGTTLFIRNVPFTATEDELRTLFRAFGPLRYARITIDSATGRSRGTGFACFWNKEDADKVITQSELLHVETTGATTVAPKKNPFTLPSILTPDPSSSLAQSLVLHGRTLDVVRAVTRDEAGKLKEVGEKMREKADKRNMYLLREGVILPNTPAAELLTTAEIERRTSSFNARRTLLKSNPSLFISKTRLSVRQIPVFVTERMLKRLALHAVKTFDKEVKAGTRKALTEDELNELPNPNEELEDGPKKATAEKAKKKFSEKASKVKQTKIVRQAERVDAVTGKGRSKGYGFLEMNKHADSLRVLRWANNNPEVVPLFEAWWKEELENLLKAEKAKPADQLDDARTKRMKDELERGVSGKKGKGSLIVEFSIENVQVVQRRNAAAAAGPKDRHASHAGDSNKPSRKGLEKTSIKSEEPSPKKRKVEDKIKPASTKEESVKPANSLGAIIGRKRKERKGGKKGAQ